MLNMKESYEYPNPSYPIQLSLMEKNKEKVVPYFKLGNHQVLTISCLVWIAIWRN